MPKTYSFVLDEDDANTFYGNLQYDKENLWERQSELDPDNPSDERERVSNIEVMRVIDILLGQHEQQKATGPVVGVDLPLHQAEPLQMALYTQLTYAQRQAARYLTMIATPNLPTAALELINLEIKQYARQIDALESVMRQVGRHV